MSAQLVLAGDAVLVAVHFDARAVIQEEPGLGTRSHLGTMRSAVTSVGVGGRLRLSWWLIRGLALGERAT